MRHLCVAVVVVSVGCASAPIKKTDLAALDQADALVLQGCYDCLLEARDTYARVAAVAKARPLVVTRLFETEILITLREKELALDFRSALSRARTLARELPPAIEAARYLAAVDAVPSDDIGLPRSEDIAFRRAHASFVPTINAEMAWLATGALRAPVRQYLSHAIDCMYLTRPRAAGHLSANFNQLLGDCREALRFYDETLAQKSVHENALLGRTVCLTFLKRTDEAILAATRMIDLQTHNVDDAYYWRAWNRHRARPGGPGAG